PQPTTRCYAPSLHATLDAGEARVPFTMVPRPYGGTDRRLLMADYQYLIIGGGMTADAAATGIREVDPVGTIGMISADRHPPYNRPPLSKGLWKGEAVESIWRGTEARGVKLHLGRRVVGIDAHAK